MGLDTVELVMEVESTFGIALPDEDASRIITVGDLYRHVLVRLPGQAAQRCTSAAAFYRLRHALIERCGADRGDVRPSAPTRGDVRPSAPTRGDVRPSAPTEALIPKANRRSTWVDLGHSLNWRLPALVRPRWMVKGIFGWTSAISLIIAAKLTWDAGFGVGPPMLLGLLVLWALLGAALTLLTAPFATRFPDGCETIGGATREALALNYAKILRRDAGSDPREVWAILRDLIVRQLGVSPDEVKESAEFVRDFGAE